MQDQQIFPEVRGRAVRLVRELREYLGDLTVTEAAARRVELLRRTGGEAGL
ncbi:MAG: hypothetical protein GX772_00780 [Alcaligenaceae bacterium]|nr:hypothetical protein [Alcaligenaceae bacterium]